MTEPRGYWRVDSPDQPEDEHLTKGVQLLFAAGVKAFHFGTVRGPEKMRAYEAIVDLLEEVLPGKAEFVGIQHPEAPERQGTSWDDDIQYEAWGREGEGNDPRPWYAALAHRPDEKE